MTVTVACPVTPGDPDPARTVGLAADLAARQGANLALVDLAAPAVDVVVPAATPAIAPPPAAVPAARRTELERLGRMSGCDDVSVESVEAPTRDALCHLSARPDVELLVVHDTGGGPLRARIAGSIGRDVMREVRCPIVLTPLDRARPLSQQPVLVCAVADDGSTPAVAAFAASLAATLDAWLHIVHVDDGDALAPLRRERLIARCRAAMRPDAEVTFVALEGRAAPLIVDEAAAIEPDLVITGRPGHGAIGSALSGSVTHALLNRGPAPVVVVPEALGAPLL